MNSAPLQEIAFLLTGPLRDLRTLHTSVWSVMRSSRSQHRNFLFSFAEQGNTIGIIVRSRFLPARLVNQAKPLPQARPEREIRFALRANPVIRAIDRCGKTAPEALLGSDNLLNWLRKQGARHGFLPCAVSYSQRCRHCTSSQGQSYVINDVVFRGTLRITAPDCLQQALEHGIGRSKAFGYGMLLLASQECLVL